MPAGTTRGDGDTRGLQRRFGCMAGIFQIFDRQRLIDYLTCRGVMNRQVDVRIVGASKPSIAPAWRFTGIGSTLVRPG